MKGGKLRPLFPNITNFVPSMLQHPVIYITAAGFEDRATTLLDYFLSKKIHIERALAIRYQPNGDPRNKVTVTKNKLEKVCPSVGWINYDRLDPQKFQRELAPIVDSLSSFHVLIDISGMSKFLTMVLLQAFTRFPNNLSVVYAEAGIYYPTKKKFEKMKKKLGATPDFLTSDVYTILHVTSLSSVSMQGYPILLLVYPTFNHHEVVALHNEVSPQHLILLEGDPHKDADKWRLQAVREVNRSVTANPDYHCESKVVSTFDYISNIETLEEIYQRYCFTHKILLATTGSKLQTIASFLFKQLHPDMQIVYPVTKAFIGEYSEGCKALWAINFGPFYKFTSLLNEYRYGSHNL